MDKRAPGERLHKRCKLQALCLLLISVCLVTERIEAHLIRSEAARVDQPAERLQEEARVTDRGEVTIENDLEGTRCPWRLWERVEELRVKVITDKAET